VGLRDKTINPLNAELNFICHLLTLLEAHHILHVSRIRVNDLQSPTLYTVINEKTKKKNECNEIKEQQ
jgi:hypothetical protein